MATYNEEQKTPATGIVGTVLGGTALAVTYGILGGNGLNLFGNNNGSTAAAIELAKKDAEISLLKANSETDKKLVDVYTTLRALDKNTDANVANLSSRVLALETAGPLKEQLFDAKIGAVYDKITCCCNSATASIQSTNDALASLQATVGNLTKTVIPITNVCPQPMPQYNSWTAPTANTANAG